MARLKTHGRGQTAPAHDDNASLAAAPPAAGRTRDEIAGPPRRRRWTLVLVPVVLLVGIAAVVGMLRMPTYTAKVRMRVVGLNLGVPGAIGGLFTASQSLASTYSLTVDADGVIRPVAQDLGEPEGQVRRSVSASAVAQTPIFVISARGKSRTLTQRTANLVAESLTRFVASQTTRVTPEELFAQFRRRTLVFNEAQAEVTDAQRVYNLRRTAANRRRLVHARTDLQIAGARRELLQTAYRNARINQAPQPAVQILRRAATAESDRISVLQILLFGGAIAGGLIGLALATLVVNRARQPAA